LELSIGKSIHGNENTSLSTTISPITINPSKIWSNSDFFDHLLNYTNYDKRDYEKNLEGETWVGDKIWTPNIFIENEVQSELMSTIKDSVQVTIRPTGEVTYHFRMKTSAICDVQLQRFPHDEQNCELRFESWTLTVDEMELQWESIGTFDKYEFTMNEYVLVGDVEFNQTTTYYDMPVLYPVPRFIQNEAPRLGKLTGNYSTLLVKFTLSRHVRFQ